MTWTALLVVVNFDQTVLRSSRILVLGSAAVLPPKPYRAHPKGGGDMRVSPPLVTASRECLMAPYRECAAYLRSSAQKMRHADNRKNLLATADRYDQLAGSLERKAGTPTQPQQA